MQLKQPDFLNGKLNKKPATEYSAGELLPATVQYISVYSCIFFGNGS